MMFDRLLLLANNGFDTFFDSRNDDVRRKLGVFDSVLVVAVGVVALTVGVTLVVLVGVAIVDFCILITGC